MKKINWEWCWGKGSRIKPPYAMFFKTSCDKHDKYYEKGWDWFDRFIADLYLLKFMIYDCFKQPFYKIGYYLCWCLIYHLAVRIFWRKFFNYNNHE